MKISIYNFKSIESIVDFEIKPFTILSGTNSSGKSSFIQLLLLLKQTIDIDSTIYQIYLKGELFQVKSYLDIITGKTINNKLEVIFNFDKNELVKVNSSPEISVFESFDNYSCIIRLLFDFIKDKEIVREFKTCFILPEGDKKEQFIKFINNEKGFSIVTNTGVFGDILYFNPKAKIVNINYSSIYPSNYEYVIIDEKGQEISKKEVPQIDGIKNLLNGFFKNISYIGPLREQPKDEYFIKGENNYVGTKGEFLAEVLENHSNDQIEYYQLIENNDLIEYGLVKSKLIEAVKYWLCDIFHLSNDIYTTKKDDIYSIILVNKVGIKATIKHVGFGISQILPIIVEGLRIPIGGTLILEQPEIHLHPKIQSLLFDFLNSLVTLGKNVIIETHSDHLITRMRRRIAEDERNLLKNKINLTFIESDNGKILFRNITLDDFGTIRYFPEDFIERPDIELRAILKAQMNKRLGKKVIMEYIAVIDISTFIWCQDDFEVNTNKYYELMQTLPNLFTQIKKSKIKVLLRAELLNQILIEFPYRNIPSEYFDFQISSLAFLTSLGTKMVVYPSDDIESITSNPNLIKHHFSNSTIQEVRFLITRLHTVRIPLSNFFTCQYLWQYDGKLTTTDNDNFEIETIIYDNEKKLDAIFLKFRILFEHNPKHNLYKTGSNISPLSCYNERNGDKSKVQKLLDEAEQLGDSFYNFDIDNNVYIVFKNTEGNKYHGYNEQDRDIIPNEIRKIFNK